MAGPVKTTGSVLSLEFSCLFRELFIYIRADEGGSPRMVGRSADGPRAAVQHLRPAISGLTVATILWVRIATVGAGGQLGAWSDPAKIVVG